MARLKPVVINTFDRNFRNKCVATAEELGLEHCVTSMMSNGFQGDTVTIQKPTGKGARAKLEVLLNLK